MLLKAKTQSLVLLFLFIVLMTSLDIVPTKHENSHVDSTLSHHQLSKYRFTVDSVCTPGCQECDQFTGNCKKCQDFVHTKI